MNILLLGDVVGKPGRAAVAAGVPLLRAAYDVDLVVANAENSAGGSGVSIACYKQLVAAGVDAFTMGDHVYRNRDIYALFNQGAPICKPANYPPEAPGPDFVVATARNGVKTAVVSVLGRVFMKPVDCPFKAVDRVLAALPADVRVVVVDVHAEATSDKQLMLHHLRGRVAAVVGTHTHVPTADAAVHPPGTAYITDLGMTGPYDGIIGRRVDRVLPATLDFKPTSFDVASGDPRVSGLMVTVDPATGRALAARPIHLGEAELAELAARRAARPAVLEGAAPHA
ncbi:MAG: TIGR00282 family metallophosphoesterase [Planctomycetia bacterium]